MDTANQNPRSAPAILSRGATTYGGSNAPPGAGRPANPAPPVVSMVPKMNQLNLAGAIERKLRGSFAPQHTPA